MKEYILLILALFLISGCATEEKVEKSGCEPPRIMYEGECCLDIDDSGKCDMIEEALKKTEQVKKVTQIEEVTDKCVEMSSWLTCEDISVTYDKILEQGFIKIQLKNNREGILVIKKFTLPEINCEKELSWSRDLTGMLPGQSDKYVIECSSLSNIDVLDTTIEMEVNYYEKIQDLDPSLPTQYMQEVEQIIKGRIKGST